MRRPIDELRTYSNFNPWSGSCWCLTRSQTDGHCRKLYSLCAHFITSCGPVTRAQARTGGPVWHWTRTACFWWTGWRAWWLGLPFMPGHSTRSRVHDADQAVALPQRGIWSL